MAFGVALCDAWVGACVPPGRAKAVVLELGQDMLDRLATRHDLLLLKQELKQDLRILGQNNEMRLSQLGQQLTLRMGAMFAAAVTVPVALQELI